MKLKFLKNRILWIPNIGVYNPSDIVEVKDEDLAKKMIDSGYFKEMKEKKPKEKGSDLDG